MRRGGITTSEERTGSAYMEWFRGTFPAYAKVLDFIEEVVYHRIPRFSDYITELDVYELTLVLRALGLDDKEYNLRSGDAESGAVLEFYRALGDVQREFMKKVDELRPTDPILDKIEKLKTEDEKALDDIMEVGKGEL